MMSLPELSIKRSVMAWMLGFIFILFGVIGYDRIPVQKMPNSARPVLTIEINLPGGNPEIINQTITQRVEDAMNQIQGVKNISSQSKLGESKVQLNFNYDTDMNLAIAEVQAQLNRISDKFPANTKPAIINFSAISSRPVMLISLYGEQSLEKLSNLVTERIQKRLEGVDGVASAKVVGVGERGVSIVMDLKKMKLRNVTVSDITAALDKHHVNIPGGFINNERNRFVLDLNAEFNNIEDLKRLIIKQHKAGPVYLGSIAEVNYDTGENSGQALYNGIPSIGISIVKKPLANTVSVVNGAKAVMQEAAPQLPPGVKYDVVYEEATAIQSAIDHLQRDSWLSIITAGIVIFFFLMSIRATGIVAIAIPVSVLGVVAVMYFTGYSFNIITLLGIILLVGVVVDDAIIVLENIYRHMEESGKTAVEVAGTASKEVVFAVLASTLTLLSIFIPVVFMQGEVSLFFKSFAVVVSAGVIISLIVSLTLTPMMCSKYLTLKKATNPVSTKVNEWIENAEVFYQNQLHKFLEKPKYVLYILLGIVVVAIPSYMFINKEFMPAEAQENVFRIGVNTPIGSSNVYVQSRISALAKVIKVEPGVKNYFSTVTDAGQGDVTVTLKPEGERKKSQNDIVNDIAAKMKKIPGAIFQLDSADLGNKVTFQLQGPELDEVLKLKGKVLSVLSKKSDLGNVFVSQDSGSPEFRIEFDRDLVSKYHLSTREILKVVSSLSNSGLLAGYYSSSSSSPRAEINLRTKAEQFKGADDLHHIFVRNDRDKLISLESVAKFIPETALSTISRDNLNYSTAFTATPTVSTAKAAKIITETMQGQLPKGYNIVMTGQAKQYAETSEEIMFTVFLILLLMYIVLACQFNSFIQPVILMLAIPLALVGGVFLLWISTLSLNIYSMIGMMLLMGLVAKNSILLLDLTNHLRQQGKGIKDALFAACPVRMRPVVMTSLAIIAAMIPTALLGGDSANRGLAIVIIGGMISSTVLSLIVVPGVYLVIERWLERFKQKRI